MAARLLLLCGLVFMWSSWAFRVAVRRQNTLVSRFPPTTKYIQTVRRRLPCRCFATQEPVQETETAVSYEEFTRLAQEIRRHDALYYNNAAGTVELADDEYDALVQLEADLCQKHPEFLSRYQQESGLGIQATRFGGRVGAVAPKQQQERQTHLRPMLSLENVHTEEQLFQWLERIRTKVSLESITIVTEPKLDGLSLSLRYAPTQNETTPSTSSLQWAATRGDGTQGQEVTHAVHSLQGIPHEITESKVAGALEVRGEVILPTSAFEGMNFSNARNAASGILLRKAKELDEEDQKLRSRLRFFAYDVVFDNDSQNVQDGVQLRSMLGQWGFHVPEPIQVTELQVNTNDTNWNDTQPMFDYYNDLDQHRQGLEAKLDWGDYEMDGVVHKVSMLSLRSILGSTSRSPRWAVAHKFPSQTAVTFLQGLDVQVGRTGALTPVALLQPVDVGGVSVKRATLHNFAHLAELMGTTKVPVGTQVLVRRAGDVIPQVVQRVLNDTATTKSNDVDMISLETPTKCPACGSPVEKLSLVANNTEGQVVRCAGPPLLCPPRAVGALAHAFSRDALDVKGLSEARIQQLLDADLMHIPADIFELANETQESNSSETLLAKISELPGWGNKSATNLADVVKQKAANGISLSRFIFSLGIRHAGQHTSKLIASAYGSVDDFLAALEDRSENDEPALTALVGTNETEGIKGIGPAQISTLRSFAAQKASVAAARDLARVVPIHDVEKVKEAIDEEDAANKPWQGYTVVFTGSLPKGLTRSKAKELARELGAKATPGTVSKSTDLVVAGVKGGKKLDQATTLGVRVMDAEEFVKLVETHASPLQDET